MAKRLGVAVYFDGKKLGECELNTRPNWLYKTAEDSIKCAVCVVDFFSDRDHFYEAGGDYGRFIIKGIAL